MASDAMVRRAMVGAAIIGPVGAAVAVRFLVPLTGPAGASAAVAPSADPPVALTSQIRALALTPEQQRVADAIARERPDGAGSPFFIPKPSEDPALSQLLPNPRASAEPEPEIPAFAITSIIAGRRTFATVNGKVRSVGDEVAPGWRVESIDPRTGTVTLNHLREGRLVLHINEGSR